MLTAFTTITITGCKKDDTDDAVPSTDPGTVNVQFNNLVGTQNLELNTGNYTNEMGQPFTVSTFKYYVSNLKLKKTDGTYFTVANSYYLIEQDVANSNKMLLSNLPAGEYTALEFVIGVDSTRNCSGAQTGALDPSEGMFWTWNSGYIFLKFEGNSTVSADSSLTFHIGGYKGANNCIKNATINFTTNLIVNSSKSPKLAIDANVLEMFKSPTAVDFSTFSFSMGGPSSVTVANNYVDMFKFNSITN